MFVAKGGIPVGIITDPEARKEVNARGRCYRLISTALADFHSDPQEDANTYVRR